LNRETICWRGASDVKIPLANHSIGGEPARASQDLRAAEDGLNLHMVFSFTAEDVLLALRERRGKPELLHAEREDHVLPGFLRNP